MPLTKLGLEFNFPHPFSVLLESEHALHLITMVRNKVK